MCFFIRNQEWFLDDSCNFYVTIYGFIVRRTNGATEFAMKLNLHKLLIQYSIDRQIDIKQTCFHHLKIKKKTYKSEMVNVQKMTLPGFNIFLMCLIKGNIQHCAISEKKFLNSNIYLGLWRNFLCINLKRSKQIFWKVVFFLQMCYRQSVFVPWKF